MTRRVGRTLLALAVFTLCTGGASARTTPETFTATASVKKGAATATAPLKVVISRYASESEVAGLRKAASAGGAALRTALSALEDAGFVQLGERRTTLKFAASRPTGSGRLITILTAEPMLFLGAGIPAAKPAAGFDVAIAMLILEGAAGTGELAPAAKVGVDNEGAIVIEDYGATVVWLSDVAAAK